jgi:uncharacterized metal-binding protein YceD (DUF177 family)
MLRGEVSRISVDYMLTPEELTDVTLVGDAHVMGEITNEAGYMRLTLEATLNYEGECARCLSPVKDVFVMQFERTVADEGTLTDEQLEDNVDEYVIIQNGELDLDEELREALICPSPCEFCATRIAPGCVPSVASPRERASVVAPRARSISAWRSCRPCSIKTKMNN